MSLLAALVLAAASARIESVSLTTLDSRLAVRILVSGTTGMVAVHREGEVARVSVMDADLGIRFAGGRRFAWTPSDGFDPALLAATPANLERLEIVASPSEVSVLLHVPPEVSVDVRRDARGLLLVFTERPRSAEPQRVARAGVEPVVVPPAHTEPTPAPQAPVPAPVVVVPVAAATAPAVTPPAVTPPAVTPPAATAAGASSAPVVAEARPAVTPPPASTAELAQRLFPAPSAEAQASTTGSVSELYPRLFPTAAPEAPAAESVPLPALIEPGQDPGLAVGPFRVRASMDARYVDADTFVESTAQPTRERYLEVQPRVAAAAPVGEGRFTLDFAPVFRAFATHSDVNSTSNGLSARLDLPVGSRVSLRAGDRFRAGVLDTRVVDPGGEYFFGLGHFRRNDADAGASVTVGPRLSVELGAALGTVRFQETSSFFDYDTRSASAGFGFEVTPNLKAIASYVYDAVPRPDQRPEAEATAHSGRLTLTGDILALLTGEVSVGYRDQSSPNAGPGGQRYSGVTLSAALSRQIARDALLAVYASRSTPVSAYEENAFYVSSSLQGTLQVPIPARFQLRGGLGYQWNDYRTVATEIGKPREDRILGWYVGLRRPVRRNLFLSGAYRAEDRRSNVDTFDVNTNGFYFQLEWDIFGAPVR